MHPDHDTAARLVREWAAGRYEPAELRSEHTQALAALLEAYAELGAARHLLSEWARTPARDTQRIAWLTVATAEHLDAALALTDPSTEASRG